MTEIYKDDVMQPKPNSRMKQQDYGIKTSLNKLSLTKAFDVQAALVDLFVDANKTILKRWQEYLEENHEKKTIIRQDLFRFET